jgi:hypothetical protein
MASTSSALTLLLLLLLLHPYLALTAAAAVLRVWRCLAVMLRCCGGWFGGIVVCCRALKEPWAALAPAAFPAAAVVVLAVMCPLELATAAAAAAAVPAVAVAGQWIAANCLWQAQLRSPLIAGLELLLEPSAALLNPHVLNQQVLLLLLLLLLLLEPVCPPRHQPARLQPDARSYTALLCRYCCQQQGCSAPQHLLLLADAAGCSVVVQQSLHQLL